MLNATLDSRVSSSRTSQLLKSPQFASPAGSTSTTSTPVCAHHKDQSLDREWDTPADLEDQVRAGCKEDDRFFVEATRMNFRVGSSGFQLLNAEGASEDEPSSKPASDPHALRVERFIASSTSGVSTLILFLAEEDGGSDRWVIKLIKPTEDGEDATGVPRGVQGELIANRLLDRPCDLVLVSSMSVTPPRDDSGFAWVDTHDMPSAVAHHWQCNGVGFYGVLMPYGGQTIRALVKHALHLGKEPSCVALMISRALHRCVADMHRRGVYHGNITAGRIVYNKDTTKLSIIGFAGCAIEPPLPGDECDTSAFAVTKSKTPGSKFDPPLDDKNAVSLDLEAAELKNRLIQRDWFAVGRVVHLVVLSNTRGRGRLADSGEADVAYWGLVELLPREGEVEAFVADCKKFALPMLAGLEKQAEKWLALGGDPASLFKEPVARGRTSLSGLSRYDSMKKILVGVDKHVREVLALCTTHDRNLREIGDTLRLHKDEITLTIVGELDQRLKDQVGSLTELLRATARHLLAAASTSDENPSLFNVTFPQTKKKLLGVVETTTDFLRIGVVCPGYSTVTAAGRVCVRPHEEFVLVENFKLPSAWVKRMVKAANVLMNVVRIVVAVAVRVDALGGLVDESLAQLSMSVNTVPPTLSKAFETAENALDDKRVAKVQSALEGAAAEATHVEDVAERLAPGLAISRSTKAAVDELAKLWTQKLSKHVHKQTTQAGAGPEKSLTLREVVECQGMRRLTTADLPPHYYCSTCYEAASAAAL